MQNIVFSFFDVAKCGYFRNRENEPAFGNLEDTLEELQRWVKKKSLSQTCTYEVLSGGNYLRTFCLNIEKNTSGDILVTLWNEVPSEKGKIPSVRADQSVGDVSIQVSELPKNSIPGYPTYFWAFPKSNFYATVCEEGGVANNPAFVRYLYEFMCKFTSYVDRSPEDRSTILGYSQYEGEEPQDLKPRFVVGLRKRESEIKYIRENYTKIRKIIRKNKLSLEVTDDNRLAKYIWKNLSFNKYNPDAVPKFHKIKYEIDYTPRKEELIAIIEEWSKNNSDSIGWDNIGFLLQNDSKTRWLTHSIARFKEKMRLPRDPSGFFSQKALFSALNGSKQKLLARVAE